jgi:hypothetical protein
MKTALIAWAMTAMAAVATASPRSEIDLIIDKLVGTLRVYAQPYMIEGKLSGCQYVFETIIRDWSYREGQPLKVTGSVAIMGLGGSIGTTLKVVVNEVRSADDFRLTLVPSPPSRAYLIDREMKTNVSSLIDARQSDTPGSLFSVFSPTPTMGMILEGMESKKITLAFNQKDGRSDLQLPIDLTVEQTDDEGKRTRSEQATIDFATCTQRLIESLR